MVDKQAILRERRRMGMAHRLTAELVQRDVDPNLLRTAESYLQAYPQADFADWLQRLARLGNLFSSSQQTGRYRLELMAACERLRPQPASSQEWAYVLAWSARLYAYYKANMRLARQISDVSHVTLPPSPPVYQPPAAVKTAPRPRRPVKDEPVKKEAEDLFAQMQKLWAAKEEDE